MRRASAAHTEIVAPFATRSSTGAESGRGQCLETMSLVSIAEIAIKPESAIAMHS